MRPSPGKGLDDIAKVEFGHISIPFSASKDGTSVTLHNLKKAGVTSTAAIRSLDFYFKEKSVPVKVDVVTEKVETVAARARVVFTNLGCGSLRLTRSWLEICRP